MKRKRKTERVHRDNKRQKSSHGCKEPPAWALLRQYYPEVLTLRRHLASKLTSTSKNRRKRLLQYGLDNGSGSEFDADLSRLLDGIAVGTFDHAHQNDGNADLDKDISVFTQQVSESLASIGPTQGALKQNEIVDFVLWQLFRTHGGSHTPPHMLCRGYQRYATNSVNEPDISAVPGVPGLFCNTDNPYVATLKKHPWCALPPLLGQGGERILADLFMHCGLFLQVVASSNLNQLSGVPLSDLKPLSASKTETQDDGDAAASHPDGDRPQLRQPVRQLSDIRFFRHRMLYARPTISSKGRIRLGLPRVHAFNQQEENDSDTRAKHVLKYLFPRQFGLHNVFTSHIDLKDTSQPFMDYTLRDKEIARLTYDWKQRRKPADCAETHEPPLPKRLRGRIMQLAVRILKRHSTCAYNALLEYHCPSPLKEDIDSASSIKHASTPSQVSAFCRAVVSKVFPGELWGLGETRVHNRRAISCRIDRFIRQRRYESLTLHDVLQDIKIQDIDWTAPIAGDTGRKMSASDFAKRKELMAELLYYIFDSFLIPLIRGHFHVTESGAHRNQLFYFRHDVWKALSDPALASLKDTMLEESNTTEVNNAMPKRALGVSTVRLLPKEHGMRPIINLRRRMPRTKNGQLVLGRSINSILTPAFSILNHEKGTNIDLLASAMFSVEEIYPRLQSFRHILDKQGLSGKPLFFAKVDVKACFDTIPQQRLMVLANKILGHEEYRIAKYARGKLIGSHSQETPGFGTKSSWRYLTKATAGKDDFDFAAEARDDTVEGRTRSIYVDGVVQKTESRQAVLDLLEEHIQSNLIKLGNKIYRQKEGIPQGSIVSSLLCSYFYSEMERELLGFVKNDSSILIRLIDDFLVISTKQDVAERFLRVMHAGIPEFGIEIKAEKSRVNFDVEIDDRAVPRLPGEYEFPYCGNAINTVTLDLSKDKERRKKSNIPDSMSVEYSKLPGQTFYRKTLSALKLQMQPMLLSTSYNSLPTVLSNLRHSFIEVAQKSYHYIHSLPASKQPPNKLITRTIDDLIKLACVLMKRRERTKKDTIPYGYCVSGAQARWLACTAFREVFQRRQTKYIQLLAWLDGQLKTPAMRSQAKGLGSVVDW